MNPFTPHGAAGSSSTQADSHRSHKSAGHGHVEKKHSHKSSSHEHSHHNGKPSHKSSSHERAEKKEKQCHKTVSHDHAEKKDKHSHRSSEHSSGHSSRHRSREHSSRGHSHHRSESDKSKHRSEKLKHSGDKHGWGSSKPQGSSDQDKSPSGSHSKTSEPSTHKYRCPELNNKQNLIKLLDLMVGDSSGYIISPVISSDEEGEAAPSVSKPPSTKNHVHHTSVKNQRNSLDTKSSSSTEAEEEAAQAVPVMLSRHHLKPIKDRVGGSLEERIKMLDKLKSIQQRNEDNHSGPSRKRSAWGEVKNRRAKREKLDGDFTGSCVDKINYGVEDKPSLKRPAPRPEETTEKKPRMERTDRQSGKQNWFDKMHEKPKVMPKPAPQPPALSFSEVMKLAEQNLQTKRVMVDMIPKKEKERRPLTQADLDRKKACQERVKTQEYKDWYKYGRSFAEAKTKDMVKPDSESGGFQRPSHDVVPPKSWAKSLSIPRKCDDPCSATKDKRTPSTLTSHRAEVWNSANHWVPIPQSKPHPTRPGMIANKPQAMAQHINNQRRAEAARPVIKERQKVASSSSSSSSQASSSALQPKPSSSALANKTRQGSAWDNLFGRPEYKKMKEASESKKRKRVIDSEEEDDYEDNDYDDLDDFIDDGEDEGCESSEVSSIIQKLFNKHGRKTEYSDSDSDDANMESSFSEVMKEEARSVRIGLQEDLEDIRREKEEERRKKMMRKKGRL